jgi:hypothetical protein
MEIDRGNENLRNFTLSNVCEATHIMLLLYHIVHHISLLVRDTIGSLTPAPYKY